MIRSYNPFCDTLKCKLTIQECITLPLKRSNIIDFGAGGNGAHERNSERRKRITSTKEGRRGEGVLWKDAGRTVGVLVGSISRVRAGNKDGGQLGVKGTAGQAQGVVARQTLLPYKTGLLSWRVRKKVREERKGRG